MRWVIGCLALLIACASEEASDPKTCVPGAQVACDCPGNQTGFQLCNGDGTAYGECTSCSSGTGGGSGGFPTSDGGGMGGGATGGVAGTASGGTGAGGTAPTYSSSDCLVTANNDDSEVCDDAETQVQATGPLVLVCLTANGGKTYVAKNTGPVMFDGIPRCQGWETNGQNPWDHLDYIYTLDCTSAQATLDIDMSAYVGQTVWVGVHNQPTGGGANTPVCVALKK
jgi:hypothetical protein